MINGIVSLLDQYGEMKYKIIAGCNGNLNLKLVESILNEERDITSDILLELCWKIEFGCKECLVIMENGKVVFAETDFEEDEDLLKHYEETFKFPFFNPRTEGGNCGVKIAVSCYISLNEVEK